MQVTTEPLCPLCGAAGPTYISEEEFDNGTIIGPSALQHLTFKTSCCDQLITGKLLIESHLSLPPTITIGNQRLL